MKSILLVEDSRSVRRACERTLIRAGYHVFSTGDGEEALQIARHKLPDLILLDLLLPGISGEVVLENLKTDPITAHVPVIILSSLSEKNEYKLKRAGAAAYFQKSNLDLIKQSAPLIELVQRMFSEEAAPTPAGT